MNEKYDIAKKVALEIYSQKSEIHCPFFNASIKLNSNGFHHLQYSGERERGKKEQILKFNLLPLALKIISRSGTLQEYRTTMAPAEKGRYSNKKNTALKRVEYWAFVSIESEPKIRVRVILRRLGDGHLTFWSVMPDIKLGGADQFSRLYSTEMEND